MKTNIKRNSWILVIIIVSLLIRYGYETIIGYLDIDYPFQQFLSTASTWLTSFIAILIWIGIVIRTEYSISKLPWLMILIMEPFSGVFLFLTFGRDFRESNRYKKHPLIQNGKYLTNEPKTDFELEQYKSIDSEITDIYKTAYNMTNHHAYLDDSKATVLTDGISFFPKLKEELNKAENFILMQFYIVRTDKLGKEILNILKEKSKQGVKVYLLYDAVGSYFLNKKFMNSLAESGVLIKSIDPIKTGFFDTRVNYRNHRKVVVIDGKAGFIGGMNLADEYLIKTKKLPMFRDTQLLLEGKILNSVTSLFFRDWYYATKDFIDDEYYFCAQDIEAKGMVQLIPSGPDFKYPPIRNTYVKLINNAKKSIKIMTPYLALDHETITSLIIASRGGVEVEIIVPGAPDKKIIYEVTRSFFQELLEEGVKIYTYPKKFTHAKVLIVDDNIASCGTYNLDNRSARINFEVTCLLYQQGVGKLVSDFDLDRSNAKIVNHKKWIKRNIFI